MTDLRDKPSRLWGTLIAAIGLLNIAMYLYRGRAELHQLLTGVGFLLIAPQASLRFPRGHVFTQGAAVLGLLLMVVGLFAY
jgi:hypothetical protein